eukprot:3636495-Rhodomonas_salina.1
MATFKALAHPPPSTLHPPSFLLPSLLPPALFPPPSSRDVLLLIVALGALEHVGQRLDLERAECVRWHARHESPRARALVQRFLHSLIRDHTFREEVDAAEDHEHEHDEDRLSTRARDPMSDVEGRGIRANKSFCT